MGIEARTALWELWRRANKRAFLDVVSRAKREKFLAAKKKAAGLYNCVERAEFDADAVVIDLSSISRQIAPPAETGSDILRALDNLVAKTVRERNARIIVFCVDNRRYVPVAKSIERAKRKKSSTDPPYSGVVPLHINAAPGVEFPLDEYEFGLDIPMPADYRRMMNTSALADKFYSFIALLLYEHVTPPIDLRIVVSGARIGRNGAPTLHMIHSRDKPPRKFETRELRLGEAEMACVYWALRLMRTLPNSISSVMIRANDSDASMALLLNVPRFLRLPSPSRSDGNGERHSRQVWLDYTAPGHPERFMEMCGVWRGVHAWTKERMPAPMHQHSPCEALLVASLLAGCDYTRAVPGIGAGTVIGVYEKKPELLAATSKLGVSVVQLPNDPLNSSAMFVAENKLYDFVWECLSRRSGFAQMTAAYNKHYNNKLLRMTIKDRFDTVASEALRYNVRVDSKRAELEVVNRELRAAGKRPRSMPQKCPVFGGFGEIRAIVRRMLWTLDYYRNSCFERPLLDEAPHTSELASLGGISVYGYVRDKDSGKLDDSVDIASNRLLEQPFIHRVMSDVAPLQKKTCARMTAERRREISKSEPPRHSRNKKRKFDDYFRCLSPISAHEDHREKILRTRDEVEAMCSFVDEPYGSFLRGSV